MPNVIYTGTYYTPDAVKIADAEIAAVLGRFSLSAEYQLAMGTNIYGQLANGVYSDRAAMSPIRASTSRWGSFLSPDDYRRYDKKARRVVATGLAPEQLASGREAGSSPVIRPYNLFAAIVTWTWRPANPC